jgi:hypothetical protein
MAHDRLRPVPPTVIWSVAATGCLALTIIILTQPVLGQRDESEESQARRGRESDQRSEVTESIEEALEEVNGDLREAKNDREKERLNSLRDKLVRRLALLTAEQRERRDEVGEREFNVREGRELERQLINEIEEVNALASDDGFQREQEKLSRRRAELHDRLAEIRERLQGASHEHASHEHASHEHGDHEHGDHEHEGEHGDHEHGGDRHEIEAEARHIEQQIEHHHLALEELNSVLSKEDLSPQKREEIEEHRQRMHVELRQLEEEIERLGDRREHENRREHGENRNGDDNGEREFRDQEHHRRQLEIDIRHQQLQASQLEFAVHSAKIAEDELTSTAVAIRQAVEFLEKDQARDFLREMSERVSSPAKRRLLDLELAHLSAAMGDHDAVRHHLSRVITP